METLLRLASGLIMIYASSLVHAGSEVCTKPKSNQCGFYRECVEQTFKCGSRGYPLGYGEKYCQRFNALSSGDLSRDGLVWRDATLLCLQKEIANLFVTSSPVRSCETMRDYAFKSHVRCYTQPFASICKLPVTDWWTISWVVDIKEYGDRDGRAQAIEVIKTCGPDVKDRIGELLKRLGLPVNTTEEDLSAAISRDGRPAHLSAEEFLMILRELQELRAKMEFIDEGLAT